MTEEAELFYMVDQLDLGGRELTYSETEAIRKRNDGNAFSMAWDSYRLGFLRGMLAGEEGKPLPPMSKNEKKYRHKIKSLSKNLYVIDRLGKKHGNQGLAAEVSIEMAGLLQSVCMLLIESFSQKEAAGDDGITKTSDGEEAARTAPIQV